MKVSKVAAVALLLGCACAQVWADHVHFGVVVGGPFWGPPAYYYAPPPAYYYPPAVVAAPPVYVEQQAAPANVQAPEAQVWYYCRKPKGYYPYVATCPSGWKEVTPTPPDSGSGPSQP